MPEREAIATVLFADIADSSRLYREAGDATARDTVRRCLDLMSRTIEQHGGRVLDRIGDEVMCAFPDVAAAAAASTDLHRVAEAARNAGDLPSHLRLRVGFHCGPVLEDGDRVFGETVYLARRVTSLAKADQSLTTASTTRMLPDLEGRLRVVDEVHVKGKDERVALVELLWNAKSTTLAYAPGATWSRPEPNALLVCAGREERTASASRPVLNLGRDPGCDLVLDHDGVSRFHARIELRKRGFFLVDVSTNGTRVVDAGVEPVRVRRDEVQLGARGTLELAPDAIDAADRAVVSYSVTRVGGEDEVTPAGP